MLEHTQNAVKLLGTGSFLDHLLCLLMLKLGWVLSGIY